MHAVDLGNQIERLDQCQIPPQLRALTKDHADVARVVHALCVRITPQHLDAPAGGHEHPGQHLDRGGFARAVHADIPDNLTRVHFEADLVDRCLIFELRGEKSAHRAAKTRFLFGDFENLAEFFYVYD